MKYNKIYFKFGTMFSGKSLRLISLYDSYLYKNKNVLAIKHVKDIRDAGVISSRMSDKKIKCHTFTDDDNLVDLVMNYKKEFGKPDLILIDEIQFVTLKHIDQINILSLNYKIMCYGLKTTYTADLFPSIAKLLTIAEDVEEIKSECFMCQSKATHNLLLRDGSPVYSGEYLNIENTDKESIEEYKAVCRYHYHNPIK
jgi:thymidine kinase